VEKSLKAQVFSSRTTLGVTNENRQMIDGLLIQFRSDTVYLYQAELAVWLHQQEKSLQA